MGEYSSPRADSQSSALKPSRPDCIHSSHGSLFHTPQTFRAAINERLDNPLVSLFRLGIRVLQFAFALASGISYAIELSHGSVHSDANSAFVFSQVLFGATLICLPLDACTIRTYKLVWVVEWILAIFYLALFATFYRIYTSGPVDPQNAGTDLGRMRRVVWMDLINFLLWMSSALFSSVMCCSGTKAAIKGHWETRRRRKETK
ncbi:hypothetical protein BDV96DRAFT_524299, partial [Lophiotrema nucula]